MTKVERAKYQEILDRSNGDNDLAADVYIRWKCTTDLFFLATEILGLSQAREGTRSRFDRHWHKWLSGRLNDNKDTLVLVPRGHMKSTFLKMKIIQLILQNPMVRVGLFSRTAGLVEEQLMDIRRMLATPLLRRYFPEVIPDPGKNFNGWERANQNALTTRRKAEWGRVPQEAMVEAWGMGATITGRHYDVLVLDDIINEQSISTPDQMQKVRDYYSYLQAIKEPDGFELIVGTRYHYSDIYGVIIKNNWFKERVWTRMAIEKGRPIYKFFTLSSLANIRRRVGPYVWACQYENNPVPKDLQIFPPPYPQFNHLPADKYDYYITVDPAATITRTADYTGIVVVALNQKSCLYVVEANQHRIPGNEIADQLIALMNKYKPRKVGVEFGMMTALGYIIETKRAEFERKSGTALHTPIVPIKIPRHVSKETRIERSLGSFLRDGRVYLHLETLDLMRQLEHFPRGEHDDLIDALSMQFQLIDKFRGKFWDEQMRPPGGGRSFFDLFGDPEREDTSWESQFTA